MEQRGKYGKMSLLQYLMKYDKYGQNKELIKSYIEYFNTIPEKKLFDELKDKTMCIYCHIDTHEDNKDYGQMYEKKIINKFGDKLDCYVGYTIRNVGDDWVMDRIVKIK